jgi:predicted secreted protein
MTAKLGRACTITINGAAFGAGRTKSFSINNAPVDISTDDDGAVRKLLDAAGEQTFEISLSGLTESKTLRNLAADSSDAIVSVVLTYAVGETVTGDFFITSYSEELPHRDAQTFSLSLASAGSVVVV